jgi:hypothetical protein
MAAISNRRKALQEKRQRGLSMAAGRSRGPSMQQDASDRLNTPSPKPEGDLLQDEEEADDDYPVTTTDYPVHVFPLDIYPPSFLDKSSGRRVLLAEHVIQPLLYSDGSHSGMALCDCGDCGADACGAMCCGPVCIALLAGLTECAGMGVGCVNQVADMVFAPSSGPGALSQLIEGCSGMCPTNSDAGGVCAGEIAACVASASACLDEVTGGCMGSGTSCVADISGSVANCGTCLRTTAADTVTCLQTSYTAILNAIPTCNQHQVIYHELNSCYRQLTACFR